MFESEKDRADYVRFTQELIRRPSPSGQEGAIAAFVRQSLEDIGVTPLVDKAGNIVAEISCGPGPTLLLNGHLDAVPEGNLEVWAPYNPFDGTIEGDLLIGRGVSDLKAGLAAQFFAFKHFKALVDAGHPFNGTLIFSAVVHEEAAEMLGMKVLIEQTLTRRQIDLCILCEPSSGKIALGHRGKVELVVTTKGKTAHSSQPKQGINALEKMLPVMDFIFNEMPATMKSHPVLGDNSVTITDCIVRPGAQSIIPDTCEISLDRRYSPDEPMEEVLAQMRGIFEKIAARDPEFVADVRPRSYVETTYTGYTEEVDKYHPPWATDPEQPIVKQALEGLRALGQEPECFYWKF
ncbi:MAG: M20/M25/M40 family metallo-hydrolase, partial [Eubacterium sp.]